MKLPRSYYNNISIIGSIIAATNILLIVSLYFITFFREGGSSYAGIYIYIVLPAFMVSGLILIPVGMRMSIRRAKKKLVRKKLIVDFNDSRHRNAFYIFIAGTVLFIFFTGLISYEAFHYTESNEFCGEICHSVMKPEYVAYQNLSHANVTCSECHIGSGADWFVKAKISGLYQVYSVLFNKFPRPLPTPIVDLRPAHETCEKCHWPQKFYSNMIVARKHYLSDVLNTEWNIQLRMKIGPLYGSSGLENGIHWHINKDIKIEYIPSTPDRENIPWVRYINTATNDTIVYENTAESINEEMLNSTPVRVMDCMDCHNRPSHKFHSPQSFVDFAMASGNIPKTLPEIKNISMQALAVDYNDTDTAIMTIENKIWSFYKDNYPDIYANDKKSIEKAITGITDEFQKNMFPEMNADWSVYPDHIGHIESNGCFRCHFGNHKSKDGRIISRDCNLCHNILSQGTSDSLEVAFIDSSLEFRHPVNIDNMWQETMCAECHHALY